MNYRDKPSVFAYIMRYCKPSPRIVLMHYGVKGMKWGVRRTPEELARAREVAKTIEAGIIRTTILGHGDAPKKSTPNSITDHVNEDGIVDKRTYYGPDGFKVRDIHTTNHGHPKNHPFGFGGEHAHDYEWNADGTRKNYSSRELTAEERKENDDIL